MPPPAPQSPPRWRRLLVLATINYWALLAIVTHLPPGELPAVRVNDKIEHVCGFALLAGLLTLCAWSFRLKRTFALCAVLVACMVYGAIDETTQPWTGRTCDFWDWAADTAGAGMVVGAVWVMRRVVQRRRGAVDYQI